MNTEEAFELLEPHEDVPGRDLFVKLVRYLNEKDTQGSGHVHIQDGQMIFELHIEHSQTIMEVQVEVSSCIGICPFRGTLVRRCRPLNGERRESLQIKVYQPGGNWERRFDDPVPA